MSRTIESEGYTRIANVEGVRLYEDSDSLPIGIEVDDGYDWLTQDQAIEVAKAILDSLEVGPIDEVIDSSDGPEEAKLAVAAEFNLRATFTYQGEKDRHPYKRRVEVQEFNPNGGSPYITALDADEDDALKRFNLDRMSGKVVIA